MTRKEEQDGPSRSCRLSRAGWLFACRGLLPLV